MVGIVSNNHIKQTISIITKNPLAFKTFSYVSTATIHVPLISFLFHYATGIISCSFPSLFCLLSHLSHFVFCPLFVSFSVIMRGSVSKEKAKQMLKLIFKSGKAKFRMGDYPEQGTLARKYLMSIFGKNDLFTEMDKLHRWIVERDVAWAKEVGIGGLFSFELMPIHPLVEEFIQGIVWSNMDMIMLVV
jgi:hypothetical protein